MGHYRPIITFSLRIFMELLQIERNNSFKKASKIYESGSFFTRLVLSNMTHDLPRNSSIIKQKGGVKNMWEEDLGKNEVGRMRRDVG